MGCGVGCPSSRAGERRKGSSATGWPEDRLLQGLRKSPKLHFLASLLLDWQKWTEAFRRWCLPSRTPPSPSGSGGLLGGRAHLASDL